MHRLLNQTVATVRRKLAMPVLDLLLRLRGLVDQLRTGYGAGDDGPYAAKSRELKKLLDPTTVITL